MESKSQLLVKYYLKWLTLCISNWHFCECLIINIYINIYILSIIISYNKDNNAANTGNDIYGNDKRSINKIILYLIHQHAGYIWIW